MYIQEESYFNEMENKVADLWNERREGFLSGVSGKQLYWTSLTSKQHSKAIVVVNGRIESAWKYQELFYDLYNKGFDVYSFDHRGQGLSERFTEDKQIGHVDYFSYYVDDMATILESFQLDHYQQRFLLAHSMGGAITTRYLQNQTNIAFDAVALSAPMFGVEMKWYLKLIVNYLFPIITLFWQKPFYATENKKYYPKPFEINPLTTSKARYQWFRQLYEQKPELKLGGPSARWVWQGLTGAKQCLLHADKIPIPLLLLQGSNDQIVSNRSQTTFINKLNHSKKDGELVVIEGSKHEVLFESDNQRSVALNAIFSFFEQAKRGK